MNAEIIGIGTEILLGSIINTNSAWLSQRLAEIGIDVFFHTTAGDNNKRLCHAIENALKRSDIVITTGGLGPTIDDITLDVIAEIANKPLIFKKDIAVCMQNHFKKQHMRMPVSNMRQAYIPKGAVWLKNQLGTAPGLIIKKGKKLLVSLPGPPCEMQAMAESLLLPYLKRMSPKKQVILSRTLKTTGIAESRLHGKVSRFLKLSGKVTTGIYAHPGGVDIKITAKATSTAQAAKNIAIIENDIRNILGNLIFASDNESLESKIARLLKKKTIAVAESCTGGLITSRLTDIPGISHNLLFSVIAYSNESKTKLLGIPPYILKKHGAVSAATARAMASGIRILSGSDIGMSTTGIAGPGGGSRKKPIGLCYISIHDGEKSIVRRYFFTGERTLIKFKAAQAALDMLRKLLLK
jgi:nicotinamide-nucleotide amidase